jgi:iron complex outermembrane receptor protein
MNWNTRFYDNETDNYQQDHFQLHWSEKYQKTGMNLAFSKKGRAIMKTTKEDADMSDYGLVPVGTVTTTDLVRQKWLDNDFMELRSLPIIKAKSWM